MHRESFDGFRCSLSSIEPQHESLNRACNVLQIERPKLLECEVEPPPHMVAHRSRDANATRRTFSLNSCRYIHRIPVKVSSIGNRVADVDADAKANGSIWRLISVKDRHLLLHLNGTSYRPVDAVEHDEQGIAASLDDPATMLLDRRVYQVAAQCP